VVTESLGKWLHRCELTLLYLGVLATFAMMCLTSADALSRYAFNRPIMGAYEITEKYLMVAAIFLGLAYGYRGGLFIRVTFLVDRLSGPARLAADYFAFLVSLAFCLFFLWATGIQGLRGLRESTELSTLPILVGPAYCLVPIGFFALTVIMLVDLPRVRKRQALLFTQEAPAAS
jgi:TRAP-type C4-dicarboxylate transport system permease small subunit